MKDVLETLNSLDMGVLNRIHRVLADRVKSDFHQYKDRRAVQRIAAHMAAKDIWSLGFCIAKRSRQNPIIAEQGKNRRCGLHNR